MRLLIFVVVLAWTIGLVAFPLWWYQFLVDGKIRDFDAWNVGITYIGINILVPAAMAVGCFLALQLWQRVGSHDQGNWRYPLRTQYVVASFAFFAIALGTLGVRSRAERE